MKKLMVLSGLILTVALFAGFGPMMENSWIYQNLPEVEAQATVTDMVFVDGKFFIKVNTGSEELYLHVPLLLFRREGISLKTGEIIKFEGKVIQTEAGKVVITEKFYIGDKEYDVWELLEKYRNERMERVREFIRKRFGYKGHPAFQNKLPGRMGGF